MYYGARYYDPALGRFIQADTIVPEPGNPQALNRYSYVYNNPLLYIDPTGNRLCECDEACNNAPTNTATQQSVGDDTPPQNSASDDQPLPVTDSATGGEGNDGGGNSQGNEPMPQDETMTATGYRLIDFSITAVLVGFDLNVDSICMKNSDECAYFWSWGFFGGPQGRTPVDFLKSFLLRNLRLAVGVGVSTGPIEVYNMTELSQYKGEFVTGGFTAKVGWKGVEVERALGQTWTELGRVSTRFYGYGAGYEVSITDTVSTTNLIRYYDKPVYNPPPGPRIQ